MAKSGKLAGSSTIFKSLGAHWQTMAIDTVQAYLNEIGRHPLLTKAQEVMLGTQVQAWMEIQDKDESTYTEEERRIAKNGKKAKDKFIKCNLRLVVNVARKYKSRCSSLELMDLIQEGTLGLVRAVEKFDPTRGYAMSTYAYWWIRQAIQRSIQCNDSTIKIPIKVQETSAKIAKAVEIMTQETGVSPTIEKISEKTGVKIEEVKRIITTPRANISLDKKVSDSDDHSFLIDLIPDLKYSNTVADAENQINIENIHAAIDRYLDENVKLVVLERMKSPPTSWREIEKITGINRAKLKLMEKSGIERCSLLIRLKRGLNV